MPNIFRIVMEQEPQKPKHVAVRMEIMIIFFQIVKGGLTFWNLPSK